MSTKFIDMTPEDSAEINRALAIIDTLLVGRSNNIAYAVAVALAAKVALSQTALNAEEAVTFVMGPLSDSVILRIGHLKEMHS